MATWHAPAPAPEPLARGFVPALRPPTDAPGAAAWYPFRGDRLLVRVVDDRAALLDYADLATAGADFESGHYLGRLGDVDCYALSLDDAFEPPADTTLEGLRALYGRLPDEHFSIAGRAVQILLWDQTHRFCGRCGQPTVNAPAERAKLCPQCGLLSFPRLSPAVIMLVKRGENELLLARNRAFADGFFSVLAGFVEPGESLEEAVAREVYEEVGLELEDIRYFGSQPWPFPHSLMIGFTATYAGGEIRLQEEELVEAAWFKREGPLPKLPGKLSIARKLIDAFLDSPVPQGEGRT
jgi:NAD+ diphosphatase